MKYIIIVICCILIGNVSYSQTKFETESRLSKDLVPNNAKTFVFELVPDKKIKWYKEESQEGKSIEAKTCYQNIKYSIEFNPDGTLQDVEIDTNIKQINQSTATTIIDYLTTTYSEFKIKKIQTQYSGSNSDLLDYFKTKNRKNITIKYEIVLKGKTESGKQLYELLFTENGTIESTKQIVFRNTDNIEF